MVRHASLLKGFAIAGLMTVFEVLGMPAALSICNEYGCAPGYLRCTEYGCPTDPRIIIERAEPQRRFGDNPMQDVIDLMKLQDMIQTSAPQIPSGCYQLQGGEVFCFLGVSKTEYSNVKRVSVKYQGREYHNIFVDCYNRRLGKSQGWGDSFATSSVYYKVCTDYR